MIKVTQPHLPDRKVLYRYLDEAMDSRWLTNNGPLLQKLTEALQVRMGVEHLLLVANGTLALQVAYKAVGIRRKAITTPFSFAATTSSLMWDSIMPVFCDIEPEHLCIDPDALEQMDMDGIDGIVPVHVYGNACDVLRIDGFAKQNGLKVVYDGAHAIFTTYRGTSIFNYGDAATFSLHATKVLHSVEGGGIVFKNKDDLERARQMINFGIQGADKIVGDGMNAKMSEFHAAVGLAMLEQLDDIFEKRAALWELYVHELKDVCVTQQHPDGCSKNYSYMPVILGSEKILLSVQGALAEVGVMARRYFYPSLDTLPHIKNAKPCPVSRDIARRVLCLPIYPDLASEDVLRICAVIKRVLSDMKL